MAKAFFLNGFYTLLIAALISPPFSAVNASAAGEKESASQLDDSGDASAANTSNPEMASEPGADGKSDNKMWLYGGLGAAALAAGVGMAAGGGGGDGDSGGDSSGLANTKWQVGSTQFNDSICSQTWGNGVVSFSSNHQVSCSVSGSGGQWTASGSGLSFGCLSSDAPDLYKCTAVSSTKYQCNVTWKVAKSGAAFTCRADFALTKI